MRARKVIPETKRKIERWEVAVRCHDIQVGLGRQDAYDFDALRRVGMAARLALHLRGHSILDAEHARLVAYECLEIPRLSIDPAFRLLAEADLLDLVTEGQTIKQILPKVPYYEDLYDRLGEYAESGENFNEAEEISLNILNQLSKSPLKKDSLREDLGAEQALFERAIKTGETGGYIVTERRRNRNLLISPIYFTENSDWYLDQAGAGNSSILGKVMDGLGSFQGIPLKIVKERQEINGIRIKPEEIPFLEKIAAIGMVKPPSIKAPHSGENFFLFTPPPIQASIDPRKKDIYEKAMALVAAVRQGQFLPEKIRIRFPGAILRKLKDTGRIPPTTEAVFQYKHLVLLRIGQLIPSGGNYFEFRIIDTEENKLALDIAINLVDSRTSSLEVDEGIREAFLRDRLFVDSIRSAKELRIEIKPDLSPELQDELDLFFSGV